MAPARSTTTRPASRTQRSGTWAPYANTTGNWNTALGKSTLALNTTGIENTAVGTQALGVNTTGEGNTALGAWALDDNTTGTGNVAVGTGTWGPAPPAASTRRLAPGRSTR